MTVTITYNDKCRECGKCSRHCPSINLLDKQRPKETLVCLSKDDMLDNSASGGVFITIAKHYIEKKNGIVYGVILDENFTCKHVEAVTIEELKPMQNSKYIQSEVEDCYPKVKKRLEEGRQVLFTGTPCQIAALKSYLVSDYDNLLTLEVVCHGVPNQRYWKKYIAEESKKRKINSYVFRTRANRSEGKTTLEATVTYGAVKKQRPWYTSVYYSTFIRNESFRKSCYYCQFARPERVADITMADCDSEKLYPDFYPKESKSSILLNTEKGLSAWREVENCFYAIPLLYEEEINVNTCLRNPSLKPKKRESLYINLNNMKWKSFTSLYIQKKTLFTNVMGLLKINF